MGRILTEMMIAASGVPARTTMGFVAVFEIYDCTVEKAANSGINRHGSLNCSIKSQ